MPAAYGVLPRGADTQHIFVHHALFITLDALQKIPVQNTNVCAEYYTSVLFLTMGLPAAVPPLREENGRAMRAILMLRRGPALVALGLLSPSPSSFPPPPSPF